MLRKAKASIGYQIRVSDRAGSREEVEQLPLLHAPLEPSSTPGGWFISREGEAADSFVLTNSFTTQRREVPVERGGEIRSPHFAL